MAALPLSRIIRARLDELDLTTEGLVVRSKLARSTIYSYLGDSRWPQGESLQLLAAGLGWTAAELQARLDGTLTASPSANERIARIVRLLPEVPPDRLDTIENVVALAVEPMQRRAKSRTDGTAKRLEQRRRELLTGSDPTLENEPKRRKGLVTESSGSRVRGLVHGALAMVGLNRDFRQYAAPA